MKYSKHSLYVAALVTLGLVSACQKEPNVFDQSPSARVEQFIEQTKQVLLSSPEGWEARLYPSSTQKWGGYTALIKFVDHETCEVSSDLTGSDVVTTGQYRVDNSNNPTLIFTTYSAAIHVFSEPNPEGFFVGDDATEHLALGGSGDYTFQVMSATPDSVVLVGARSRSKVLLTPVGKTPWRDKLTAIDQARELVNIPHFKLTGLGDEIDGTMDVARRHLSLTLPDGTYSLPFRFLERGIELYEPLVVGAKSVQRLLLTDRPEDYTMTSSDGSVILRGVERSPIEILRSQGWRLDTEHSGQRTRQGLAYATAAMTGFRPVFAVAPRASLRVDSTEGTYQIFVTSRISGSVLLPLSLGLRVSSSAEDEVSFSYVPESYPAGSTMDILVNQLALYSSLGGLCNLQLKVTLEDDQEQTLFDDPVGPRSYTITVDSRVRPRWVRLTDKTDPQNWIYLYSDPTGVPTE